MTGSTTDPIVALFWLVAMVAALAFIVICAMVAILGAAFIYEFVNLEYQRHKRRNKCS